MTNDNNIISFKQITGFTDIELEIVLKHFEAKKIKKKTILLEAGKIADEVYFIVSGCIRLFCIKDGEDLSTYFFTENMFAGSYDSFISRQPSKVAIESLEECEVLILTHESLESLYQVFPKMNEFIRKAIEQRFVLLHDLFISYHPQFLLIFFEFIFFNRPGRFFNGRNNQNCIGINFD